MFSGEGEEVPFKEVMYPRGNVEDWLLEVERVMMESLRQLMDEGLKDYLVVSIKGVCGGVGCLNGFLPWCITTIDTGLLHLM